MLNISAFYASTSKISNLIKYPYFFTLLFTHNSVKDHFSNKHLMSSYQIPRYYGTVSILKTLTVLKETKSNLTNENTVIESFQRKFMKKLMPGKTV